MAHTGSILSLTHLTRVRAPQQPTQPWSRAWGGTDYDLSMEVAVGSDIYIVGGTESFGSGGRDDFIDRYDFPIWGFALPVDPL